MNYILLFALCSAFGFETLNAYVLSANPFTSIRTRDNILRNPGSILTRSGCIIKSASEMNCHGNIAGDNCGILLRGVQRADIRRGMVLAKKGSIKPSTQFEGETYILTKEEGGRHTPFFVGYRPQFYVRTTDVTGNIIAFTTDAGAAVEMVLPGDRIKMTVELGSPIAIENGMKFAIREGGKTIGAGVVTKMLK